MGLIIYLYAATKYQEIDKVKQERVVKKKNQKIHWKSDYRSVSFDNSITD